jgi:glyoxylase-like metal-dependent hydrolase (beta-lactamase superfamily II)
MKISDRVYALDSTKGAYAYIILGEETTLIDTGLSFKGNSLLKELSSMKIRLQDIKHILLTHYDLDHIGNAARLAELTGAKLWASSVDRPYILGEIDRPGFKKFLPYIFRVKKPKNITPYPQDGKLGDITVIPTPGHTPGHVCLLLEDILFAGDLIENTKGSLVSYPSPWNWNTPVLKSSIKKIAHYPFKWICPAHGNPIERDNLWEQI